MTDVPSDVAGLRDALIGQRQYTLALYADIPKDWWQPHQFPFGATINPPLWELAHIAWFQEFFALRWRADDLIGARVAACLTGADVLFDSAVVPHDARWKLDYPSIDACFEYMRRVLDNVLESLSQSNSEERYGYQLALVHEDMHAEALAMTLTTLGLSLPVVARKRERLASQALSRHEIDCAGGEIAIGESARSFSFDNEKPAHLLHLAPYRIDARVVTAVEFAGFADSPAYRDARFWSGEGLAWRDGGNFPSRQITYAGQDDDFAAMHVSYHEAVAYCRWKNRRLPKEAEWECAAISSSDFLASTGHVWEWTASRFLPHRGFEAERYRDYSEPWFDSPLAPRMVLKGGSYLTHPRLKYPQYRNFYAPDRNDVFCGFRTCAIA